LTLRNRQSFEQRVPITPFILGLVFRDQVHQLSEQHYADNFPRSNCVPASSIVSPSRSPVSTTP
jgi:hypothetical protein